MKINYKKLLLSLAIPLTVGGLSALASGGFSDSYSELVQPPFAPPGWVFPVVWTILYILMGISLYRILTAPVAPREKRFPVILFGVQLLLNFLWPILFFRLEMRLSAFFLLLLLWIFILLTIRFFSRIDEKAGDLLLPYILWVTFAGYLNLGVFLLN